MQSLTTYSRRASAAKIERQLRAAYGDRVPGSPGRYYSQRAEWEAIEYERQVKVTAKPSTNRPTLDLRGYGPEADCEGCGDGEAA